MTGRDLVSASLRLIGALAPGESLAAQEATDGLASINRLISSWSTEGLLIFAETRETPLTMTVADATYTMGTSGNFTTRPMDVAYVTIQDATSGVETVPLRKLTQVEYAARDKTLSADKPWAFYDDGAFPQRTLTLYPIPSAAHKLVPYTKQPLTVISTLDTSISLPPGYERALTYNGAMELAPEYGRAVPDTVAMIAVESKGTIKRANMRPILMTPDPVPANSGVVFDIYTGDYR